MSDWRNNYPYNPNQYVDSNNWPQDQNGQYHDQGANYYQNQQYRPNEQYVSFNDFLSQMQPSDTTNTNGTNNYNNVQYQNYSIDQYNVGNMPSSSQNQNQYSHRQNNSNGIDNYQSNSHHEVGASKKKENDNHNKKAVFKSNLTPTAVEFVPKSSQVQPRNQEPSTSYSNERVYQNQSQSTHNNEFNHNENKVRYDKNRTTDNVSQNGQAKYYEGNRNQKKYNGKVNNKESDAPRTFYNSSASKSSQDVRSGGRYNDSSNNRSRNWAGTQRLRGMDRNSADDEQYANKYFQHKDDRAAKTQKSHHHSPRRTKGTYENGNKEMTQRERLSDQLDKGTLECLVCCERVKQPDAIWSCSNCYHVMHFWCIRKWATSSIQEGKWRCPACQNGNVAIPEEYRCLCGAVRSPEYIRGGVGAHTCGLSCGRQRLCPHPCTLLCHPGPCPPCQATVNKTCGCGYETRSVLCSSKILQVCKRICDKKLNCGVHNCTQACHEGICEECKENVKQKCHCPATKSRDVACSESSAQESSFSCGDVCGRVLQCGSHVCRDTCHPPPCKPCALLPELLTFCPCGNTKIEPGKRKACTDPIPLCGNLCAKPLACGPEGDKHFCRQVCHEGACPPCPDVTVLQCRCGVTNREVACTDLPQVINNVFCQKKCNKKLSCGRHRCQAVCCDSERHRCPALCNRMLSCQLHRCEDLCHTGHCAPCPRLSWEELRCACGAEATLPPVRCGARAPLCARPCARPRPCGHAPLHSCHAPPSAPCPPCVVLTAKTCHGGHEERKTIPCSQDEFSCGLPCGKPLSCGKHNCIKICHKGSCDTEVCSQPCAEKRAQCGHACGAACHAGAGGTCPDSAPCRRLVRATCPCGRREQQRSCAENARISSAIAATKMQEGGSVDLSELSRPVSLKTVECDDECRVEARTRQMALALQIRNPDVSAKLAPRYGDHVRSLAARDAAFALAVHRQLTELVQLAKKSKQRTRSHSFPSMNWQKRQFIHEMCEHFGCESVAYDAEPNRNVVATADKEKSWLPAMSVLEVLSREAGKRRVPPPVLRAAAPVAAPAAKSTTGWATLTSTNAWAKRSQPATTSSETKPPVIDYFDNPPEN